MSSGPCQLIVIEGHDAVEAGDRLKKAVRAEFSAGMFCNTVHAPTGAEEAAKAVERALSFKTRAPYRWHRDEGANEGVWGRLALVDPGELREAITAVWDRQERLGWEGIRHTPSDEGGLRGATVVLRGGGDQSIDYGMSAVADLWPEWSVEEVLLAYREADSFGRSPLAVYSPSKARAYADALTGLRMLAEVALSSSLPPRTAR